MIKSEHLREKTSIRELTRVFRKIWLDYDEKMLKILKKLLTFSDFTSIFVIVVIYIKERGCIIGK